MSWPLACFALVGGVLLVGWVAYERSRPSPRTVALVATLSALAALGRDAFAAVDEVKPITAMTFVVGYSLGPLPGFVVGAIGMLLSNMMLGQGPYTPWQMAAWGFVGVLGGLAGRASRRRLRRLPLALCCAFAALLAKEIMNLYGWTVGAAHTPAAFLAEAGLSLPYDVVDVVSTLIFGLLFGPELARLLARARERGHVEWSRAGTLAPALLGAVAIALLANPAGSARAALGNRANTPGSRRVVTPLVRHDAASAVAPRVRRDVARAVAFLASAQNGDGGFGAEAGARSSALYTGWSAVGLAAAGVPPRMLAAHGNSVLHALGAEGRHLEGVGGLERLMLALHACGRSARGLDGTPLLQRLLAARDGGGSFSGDVSLTSFGIFALRAAGLAQRAPPLRAAGRWLARQQNGDGGFSFASRGSPSDVDDTAAATQALIVSGVAGDAGGIARAVRYLLSAENDDGGFPQEPGGESNAQSTAWAAQALAAAKVQVGLHGGLHGGSRGRSARGRSAIRYLERLMTPAGSFEYAQGNAQSPVWVTAEALSALAAAPFPIAPPSPLDQRVGVASLEWGGTLDGVAVMTEVLRAV